MHLLKRSSRAMLYKAVLFCRTNPTPRPAKPEVGLGQNSRQSQRRAGSGIAAGARLDKATGQAGAVQAATGTSPLAKVGRVDPHRLGLARLPFPIGELHAASRCQSPALPATRCLNMFPEPR